LATEITVCQVKNLIKLKYIYTHILNQ